MFLELLQGYNNPIEDTSSAAAAAQRKIPFDDISGAAESAQQKVEKEASDASSWVSKEFSSSENSLSLKGELTASIIPFPISQFLQR